MVGNVSADVTRTKIAEGLREPMGIKLLDGELFISEKHQLSKLLEADSERRTPTARRRSATWPFDGNFHEFAFGLLYKDGFFYMNLSVSIDLGGATTVPQGSNDRGTHLKIDKNTGAITYVAGGLRTPHGIGWGPENEIFVTDNQGGSLPPTSSSTSSRASSTTTTRPVRTVSPAASTTSGRRRPRCGCRTTRSPTRPASRC